MVTIYSINFLYLEINQPTKIKKKRKKYYCDKCYFVTNASFYSKYIYLERHQHLN
jgi:hypothetical protein